MEEVTRRICRFETLFFEGGRGGDGMGDPHGHKQTNKQTTKTSVCVCRGGKGAVAGELSNINRALGYHTLCPSPPPLHTPFSPSLINLMVSVDVQHHVSTIQRSCVPCCTSDVSGRDTAPHQCGKIKYDILQRTSSAFVRLTSCPFFFNHTF